MMGWIRWKLAWLKWAIGVPNIPEMEQLEKLSNSELRSIRQELDAIFAAEPKREDFR